jgi:hypothetical protein
MKRGTGYLYSRRPVLWQAAGKLKVLEGWGFTGRGKTRRVEGYGWQVTASALTAAKSALGFTGRGKTLREGKKCQGTT